MIVVHRSFAEEKISQKKGCENELDCKTNFIGTGRSIRLLGRSVREFLWFSDRLGK